MIILRNNILKMFNKLIFSIFCFVLLLIPLQVISQDLILSDNYLEIKANGRDPLYTTYTAALERARMYSDKGYKMDYYSGSEPLNYSSDKAGRIYSLWKVDKLVVSEMNAYAKEPVVYASFPDMVILDYSPFDGIDVREVFWVYSSRVAMVSQLVTNNSNVEHLVEIYPILETGSSAIKPIAYSEQPSGVVLNREESLKRLISNMYADSGYPESVRDIFAMPDNNYSWGCYKGGISDFYEYMKTDFYAEDFKNDKLNQKISEKADFIALHAQFKLQPGQSKEIKFFRGIQKREESLQGLKDEIDNISNEDIIKGFEANELLFSKIPRLAFERPEEKMIYLSSFNLARGSMLPPSGEANHNFYVFSREPKWGWGHGHQVLHESLSMLSYAHLDWKSAQGSQRIYMDQQGDDGLIAYRHGPRGAQTYPHKDRPTTSAPFYSWINWEIFEVSKDEVFLKDAYDSGVKYMEWLIKERDLDQDGTFEWGPYGIIENVRDWYNAVFQVSEDRYLDVDKEDISDELECLDLSLMVCKEMRSLSKMASELGEKKEAAKWMKEADKLSALINDRMWDDETEFYYSINKKDHSFNFMTRDLRRQEIIGFLPLWAESCSAERAEILVAKLTDPSKFWRKNGIPTLSADDVWYSPNVDYCCKWNGPVWLLWNYMIFEGLLNYGYTEVAEQLADKITSAVEYQLSLNHNFWESYSPDNSVLNSPSNYIWDAIMARFFIDLKSD